MAIENKRLSFILNMVDKVTEPAQKAAQALQGLSQNVTNTQGAINKLKAQAGDLESFQRLQKSVDASNQRIKELGAKSDAMAAKISKANGAQRKASSDLKKAEAVLVKMTTTTGTSTKAMEEQARKVELLRKVHLNTQKVVSGHKAEQQAIRKEFKATETGLGKLQAELARTGDKLKAAGYDLNNMGQAFERNASKMAKATSELSKHQSELDKARRKQDELTKSKERFNKAMELSAKLSIAGVVGIASGKAALSGMMNPLKTGMEFNEQVSAVSAITRASEVPGMKEKLKEAALVTSSNSQFTATEVGKAQEYLGMAGFKHEDILASQDAMVKLATATRTDMATTADVGSNILTGMGLKADQMGRAGDVLTNTTTSANVNLTELGESFKMAGPLFSNVGMEIEEASAALGMLGDMGIKGTQAGTHLRIALSRLAGPPKMAAEQLEKLGITSEMLGEMEKGAAATGLALEQMGIKTKDEAGNLRDFADILREVEAATKHMGSGDKTAVYKKIFGAEAFVSAMALGKDVASGKYAERVTANQNAEGRLDSTYQEMSDNLAGDVKGWNSRLEVLKIRTADVFDSVARSVTQAGNKVLDVLARWVKNNPLLVKVLGLTAAAIAVVTIAAGALLLTLGGALFIFTKLGMVLKAMGPILAMMRLRVFMLGPVLLKALAAVKAISLALVSTPWGLVAAAAVAAAVLIYKHWDKVSAFFTGFWQGFTEDMAPVRELFSELAEWLAPVGELLGKVAEWFLDLFGVVRTGQDELDNITKAGHRFGEVMALLFKGMVLPIKVFTDALRSISSTIYDVWNEAYVIMSIDPMSWVREKWDGMLRWFEALGVSLLSGMGATWDKLLQLVGLDPMVSIREAWGGVADWFNELASSIWGAINRAVDKAIGKLKGLASWVTSGFGLFGGGDDELTAIVNEAPAKGSDGSSSTNPAQPALKQGNQIPPKQQTINHTVTVSPTIHVTAQPGQDTEAIAREVARQIEEMQRRAAWDNRGRMFD